MPHIDWSINPSTLAMIIVAAVGLYVRLVRLEDGQRVMQGQAAAHEEHDEKRFEKLDTRLQVGSDRFQDHDRRITRLESAADRRQ